MRSIRFPVVAALAVLSITACSRNRPGDVATEQPREPETTSQPPAAYPSPNPTPTPAPEPAAPVVNEPLAVGDSIYSGKVGGANCASCHGADAKGTDQAPDLTDDKWLHGDGSLEFIKGIVRNGVPQPKEHSAAMPGFGTTLSEEQITAVASYVRSRSARGAS